MKRIAMIVALIVACTSCTHDTPSTTVQLPDPGHCTPVDIAAAPEIAPLLDTLARSFNGSRTAHIGSRGCAFVRVQSMEAGARALRHFLDGWPDPDQLGPPPTLWAPAS